MEAGLKSRISCPGKTKNQCVFDGSRPRCSAVQPQRKAPPPGPGSAGAGAEAARQPSILRCMKRDMVLHARHLGDRKWRPSAARIEREAPHWAWQGCGGKESGQRISANPALRQVEPSITTAQAGMTEDGQKDPRDASRLIRVHRGFLQLESPCSS